MTSPVKNTIELYTAKDGKTQLKVRFEKDTLWLSQEQIAELFGVQRPGITKHLKNIFANGELDEQEVSSILEHTTTHGAIKGKTQTQKIKLYNLDAIISVGYRVSSVKATQFRIWATDALKRYLIDGYAINQKRLEEKGIEEFKKTLWLVQKILKSPDLWKEEAIGLLEVISGYTKTWSLIQQYDEEKLTNKGNTPELKYKLEAEEAYKAIGKLKVELEGKCGVWNLFANLREVGGLESIFGNIYQTFDNKELYPTVEEKAAHLLYFIVKDHPFYDGNKRSAAFLFILFLAQNGILLDETGTRKINDRALVAITIMIAESDPREKEMMVRLVLNLVN